MPRVAVPPGAHKKRPAAIARRRPASASQQQPEPDFGFGAGLTGGAAFMGTGFFTADDGFFASSFCLSAIVSTPSGPAGGPHVDRRRGCRCHPLPECKSNARHSPRPDSAVPRSVTLEVHGGDPGAQVDAAFPAPSEAQESGPDDSDYAMLTTGSVLPIPIPGRLPAAAGTASPRGPSIAAAAQAAQVPAEGGT